MYYTLYKAARKRAHEAKQVSIAAYLDAKNIKNTYNLQLVEDDSDDNDVDDDVDDHDDSHDDAIGNSDNNSSNSDSSDVNDSYAGEDDDGDDEDCNDFKKRPPINISGDSIHLSISDYDALGWRMEMRMMQIARFI